MTNPILQNQTQMRQAIGMARLARQHNDANVLALGERLTGTETAFDVVETFMKTSYEGGRHDKRVKKLSQLC